MDLGGDAQGFGKGGMGMDRVRQVFGDSAHFDTEDGFGDEFAGVGADDPRPQNSVRFRVENQFRKPLGTADSCSPARGGPGVAGGLDRALLYAAPRFPSAPHHAISGSV